MAWTLSIISLIFILYTASSQNVTCSGNCVCPNSYSGITCILNCDGKNQCKDSTLKCRAGDPCHVNCIGDNSCEGNSFIDGSGATDVTVNCFGDNACKGNTIINCGIASCHISCETGTSCEGTNVNAPHATSLKCNGNCGVGIIPPPFAMSTSQPTAGPTNKPTNIPSKPPTNHPTGDPTKNPSNDPTKTPSFYPTKDPIFTPNPTLNPTSNPSFIPTNYPTNYPTKYPTFIHTKHPAISPTKYPTLNPTKYPTLNPTKYPTLNPTKYPTLNPTKYPTLSPMKYPTLDPTKYATKQPSKSTFNSTRISSTLFAKKENVDIISTDNPLFYIFMICLVIVIIGSIICCLWICVYYTLKKHKIVGEISIAMDKKQNIHNTTYSTENTTNCTGNTTTTSSSNEGEKHQNLTIPQKKSSKPDTSSIFQETINDINVEPDNGPDIDDIVVDAVNDTIVNMENAEPSISSSENSDSFDMYTNKDSNERSESEYHRKSVIISSLPNDNDTMHQSPMAINNPLEQESNNNNNDETSSLCTDLTSCSSSSDITDNDIDYQQNIVGHVLNANLN